MNLKMLQLYMVATEYRKNKPLFHPSRTADDCCCISRQLCNTSPNPAAVEVAALKSSPLPGNHRPLPPFVTTNPCCGGASAASWMQPGHFKTCQPTCPWVSPTGGARLSGKTTDSLGSTLARRRFSPPLPVCVTASNSGDHCDHNVTDSS